MKKLFFCLTAIMLLASCNSSRNESETTTDSAQAEMTDTANQAEDTGDWAQQSTLLGSKPMIVDFFATWCGPCQELSPILDEIENQHKGEVIFRRIDVDQEPELAQEFGVQAIPMLLFVAPNGDYQSLMGLQSPEVIEAKITDLLKHSAKMAK